VTLGAEHAGPLAEPRRAPTFSGQFLGCKVSQTDLAQLRERFAADGLHEVAAGGEVHVVNGCAVTAEAVSKTRQAVRRALAAGSAHVVVTGCAARLAPADLAGLGDRVHVVDDPAETAPAAASDLLARLGCRGAQPLEAARTRTRAFVKVQDGCSFSCSFCVIPLVRGPSRSRALADVLGEVRRRVDSGHREVVLTGVNIGLYRDGRLRLADVIRAVGAVPGVERLRLSSIEVDHLGAAVVDAMAETPVALPHLHVPMQSGDDAVLRAMRRRAPAARYAERIAAARAAIDGLNVTADVIVGFPGEDDAAFGRTLDLVRATGLTRVHAFPYSPRPGTRTRASDPVSAQVKRERADALRTTADAQGRAWRTARIGSTDHVLVERVDDGGRASGYARDYTPWRLQAPGVVPGAIVTAVAVAADDDAIVARSAE
jgi:threonylcarbamoyladenosine tRNA methylthiotransferase MtaB